MGKFESASSSPRGAVAVETKQRTKVHEKDIAWTLIQSVCHLHVVGDPSSS